MNDLPVAVLDQIVRQQAEIDRLKAELEEEISSWSLKAVEQFNRADDLERQLAEARVEVERYKAGVEVEGFITVQHGLILSSASTHKIQTSLPCGIVRVLVMPMEVE